MGPHGVAIAAIARWAQAQVVQKRNETDGNGRSWQNSKRLEFIVIYCDVHGIDHYDIYIYTHDMRGSWMFMGSWWLSSSRRFRSAV